MVEECGCDSWERGLSAAISLGLEEGTEKLLGGLEDGDDFEVERFIGIICC